MTTAPRVTGALRPAARRLTGSTYAVLGYAAVREPGPRVEKAASLIATVRKEVPVPITDEQVVRVTGAIQTACGLLLARGTAPRLSALLLAGSMIPTTLAGHRFWAEHDPAVRRNRSSSTRTWP